jgi:type III secretion system YseE family protein
MADEVRPKLTKLEERFSKDKDRTELNKLQKELEGYQAEVKKALDRGVSPAEYQKLSKYQTALQQAHDALPVVWAGNVKL